MRSTLRTDNKISSAEALYGWPLVLPGSLLNVKDLTQQEVSTADQQIKQGFPVRHTSDPVQLKTIPIMKFAYLRQDGV